MDVYLTQTKKSKRRILIIQTYKKRTTKWMF